nr:MAG TPA: hypothetical protein [Caudoviricetes sp.]
MSEKKMPLFEKKLLFFKKMEKIPFLVIDKTYTTPNT